MTTLLKKNTAALAAVLWAVVSVRAEGVGSTGANFLKVGVGARSLAMAGAAVSTVDDANAIYWNPARLAALDKTSVTATYASLFEDQSQGFLGGALPTKGAGVWGVGVDYLTVSDIEKRTGDSETPDGMFKNQESAVFLSYGRQGVWSKKLDLGGNVKMIRQSLDTKNESAYAVDLGAAYRFTNTITAGITVQNVGTKLGPDPLPLLVKAGADSRFFKDRLTLALDGDAWVKDKKYSGAVGTEFWLANPLVLRAGYKFGQGPTHLGGAAGLSVGFGFRLSPVTLDYAFVPAGDLEDTHRITFSGKF